MSFMIVTSDQTDIASIRAKRQDGAPFRDKGSGIHLANKKKRIITNAVD